MADESRPTVKPESVTYFDADMRPCPRDRARFADVAVRDAAGELERIWYEFGPDGPQPDEGSDEHPAAAEIRTLAERSRAGALAFDDLIAETKRIHEHHGTHELGEGAKAVGIDPANHADKSLLHAVQGHIRRQAPGRG